MERRRFRISSCSIIPILVALFLFLVAISSYFLSKSSIFESLTLILFAVIVLTAAKTNIKFLSIPMAILGVMNVSSLFEFDYFGHIDILNFITAITFLIVIVLFILIIFNFVRSKKLVAILMTSLTIILFLVYVLYNFEVNTVIEVFFRYELYACVAILMLVHSLTDKTISDEENERTNLYAKKLLTVDGRIISTFTELLEYKNIGISILLSIITFGIYGIVWQYSICKKIKLLNNDTSRCGGEVVCLVLVPFYSLYWVNTRAKRITDGARNFNIVVEDKGILYLVFCLLGLGIVAIAMIQDSLNSIANQLTTGPVFETTIQTSSSNQSSIDNLDQIKKLSELYSQGILTDDEFAQKKKDLLDRI